VTRVLYVEPEAEAELGEAIAWYESRRRGLGLEFGRVARAAFAAIERTPELGPAVSGRIRQVVLRRFPYSIYYVLEPERIAVVAVFHGRRAPREWRRRG
jgi:toxin ParE1/3/4